MPGESIVLVGDRGGRIRSFVEALATFPTEPRWVLVGGFAVNVRIAAIHRLTADLDTVTGDASRLIELLVDGGASKRSAGEVLVTVATAGVEVDVMGDDNEHSGEPGDHAFALARRLALTRSSPCQLQVLDPDDRGIVAGCTAETATVDALVALKSVSLPRRLTSAHPEKVLSDALDLVRLVAGRDIVDLAASLRTIEPDLLQWTSQTLSKWFAADEDGRYTAARLRQFGVEADDVTLVGELGAALRD